MSSSFYNYLAFIEPDSNADLNLLKKNLEIFYENTKGDKPSITLIEKEITVSFDDYEFHIYFSEESHVIEEALEFADAYELDWNQQPINKTKLKNCSKRFEVWGDEDDMMDYFNDSLFIVETIEKFNGIIIFYIN